MSSQDYLHFACLNGKVWQKTIRSLKPPHIKQLHKKQQQQQTVAEQQQQQTQRKKMYRINTDKIDN